MIDDIGNDCLVSVDGTDFRVKGKLLANGRPDKRLYSHKFKGPGLRYEIAVSLLNQDIVWVSGPYLPGVMNDLQIFRDGLIDMLEPGERVEADNGYFGECPEFCKCPGAVTNLPTRERITKRVRNRHEAYNERFKNWECLKQIFRHGHIKHSMCMRAVVVLTQLAIRDGEVVFDVPEYDDYLDDEDVEDLFGF